MTHARSDIHALLAGADLRPSRALGQNFVADPNTVRRIVRLAGVEPGDRVLEIGAGVGSLTLALAEAGAHVVAVEVDRHLLPVLEEAVAGSGVEVVHADALHADLAALTGGAQGGGPPWRLVANLPYNVSVPVVVRVLEEAPAVASMLVMVQREVGERLAASPGDPAYGAVSVKVAYWGEAHVVGRVPPSVFVPRPNVESVLVAIDRRRAPGDHDPAAYARTFAVVRAGFAQRRKMLRRALQGVVDPAAFAAAGVPETARAEELSLGQFEALAGWRPEGERG